MIRFLARRTAIAVITLVGISIAVFAIMAANECPSGTPIDEPLVFHSESRWDNWTGEVAPKITYRWGCSVSSRDTFVLYDSPARHQPDGGRVGGALR